MTEFGPYTVIAPVAEGSTAIVYKARHREIDRIAAVKELREQLRASTAFLERFRDEARVLAGFDDPHIVTLYDFVEEPDRAWIAEEWVDGATIDALLRSSGRFTAEQSLGVLAGALRGLSYAHDRGVVHGDLTPANIIADLAGTSMLIDFGLSVPVGQTAASGTPAFLSPEAAHGAAASKTSDVYAAGVLLFSLLAGRLPFAGATVEAVQRAHETEAVPELRDHGPAMAALLADSLSKDPSQRPPDARAFLDRLEAAASDRYGADWVQRASVTGLVAAAVGAGAATTAAVTGGTAATVISSAPSVFAGSAGAVGRTAFGVSRKTLALASGAVVLVAGIAIAVALTVGGSSGSAPKALTSNPLKHRAPTSPTAPASITPSVVPATTGVLPASAKYRVVYVITSTNFPGEHVGERTVRTWTLHLTCGSGRKCSGRIKSSGGDHFRAVFNGHVLEDSLMGTHTTPCYYRGGSLKGTKVPGTKARLTTSRLTRVAVASHATGPTPPAGLALRLVGTSRSYQSRYRIIEGAAMCTHNNSKAYHDVSRVTITYLSS